MMRIMFAGTPEFSIPSLKYIYKHYEIVGILTQPDKPRGRGLKVQPSPVKEFALQKDIPCFQPENSKDEKTINAVESLKPELFISVSYGKILSNDFLQVMNNKCINFHPSLLPGYKGPNPIRWVIFNREEITGVSAHIISSEIDSGDILIRKSVQLSGNESYGTLYSTLAELNTDIIDSAVENFFNKKFSVSEDIYKHKNFYAGKMEKEDYHIKWKQSAEEIDAVVRALNPVPGAFTYYNNQILKIYESEIISGNFNEEPGKIINADKNGLIISAGKDALKLITLKLQNKKKLFFKDFLNGVQMKKGEFLK